MDFQITTSGIDELGIKLKSPFGVRSPSHVLLINDGPHHLLACEITYEFIAESGEAQPARKVVAFTYPLSEKDLAKRTILLKREPAIAPGTKWLIAMGAEPDVVAVHEALPHLAEETLAATSSELRGYKQLNIRLETVILDNGQAFGSHPQEFLTYINKLLEETTYDE